MVWEGDGRGRRERWRGVGEVVLVGGGEERW